MTDDSPFLMQALLRIEDPSRVAYTIARDIPWFEISYSLNFLKTSSFYKLNITLFFLCCKKQIAQAWITIQPAEQEILI